MALRDFILKNFWLKFFSLALAILIWETVSLAIRKEVTTTVGPLTTKSSRILYDLPVLVMSSAADVREFKVKPNSVDVTVNGEAAVLEKLQGKDIRVIVDLTDIESARDLRKRVEVSTPPGVTHIRIAPPDVEVMVPPKVSAQESSAKAK